MALSPSRKKDQLKLVQSSLDHILTFLEDYLPLANSHATDFLLKNHWKMLLPENIQRELSLFSEEELQKLPLLGLTDVRGGIDLDKGECSEIGTYRRCARKLQMDRKPSDFVNHGSGSEMDTAEAECEPLFSGGDNEGGSLCSLAHGPTDGVCVRQNVLANTNHAFYSNKCNSLSTTELDFKHLSVSKKCDFDQKCSPEVTAEVLTYNLSTEAVTKHKTEKTTDDSSVKWRHTNVLEFCQAAHLSTIKGLNLASNLEELNVILKLKEVPEVYIPHFMNQKKSYEINIMSKLCSALKETTECDLVVDIGSGKGYLGSHLSLMYNIPVIGVDSVRTNTTGAQNRLDLLSRQWTGLLKNATTGKRTTKEAKKERKNKSKSRQRLQVEIGNSDSEELSINLGETLFSQVGSFSSNFETDSILTGTEGSTGNVPSTTDPFINESECIGNDGLTINKSISNALFQASEHKDLCIEAKTSSRKVVDISEKLTLLDNIPSEGADSLAQTSTDGIKTIRSKKRKPLYIPLTTFVNTTTDLSKISGEIFSEFFATTESRMGSQNAEEGRVSMLLTGLHTCGNLGSDMLRLFVNNDDLKAFCGVGCCYHLLNEAFGGNCEAENTSSCGFPLSGFLQQRKSVLGRTARNLSSQSIHRIAQAQELQGSAFYNRALLQLILHDLHPEFSLESVRSFRRLGQRSQSTLDYVQKAFELLALPMDEVTESTLEAYEEKFSDARWQMSAWFQLKAVLAPCIESVVILDRLCYLLEQDCIQEAVLVHLFDPAVSPRCYGIVGLKK